MRLILLVIIWLLVKTFWPRHCQIERKINSDEAGQCISHVKYIYSLCIEATSSLSFSSLSKKLELQIRQFQFTSAPFSTSKPFLCLPFPFAFCVCFPFFFTSFCFSFSAISSSLSCFQCLLVRANTTEGTCNGCFPFLQFCYLLPMSPIGLKAASVRLV